MPPISQHFLHLLFRDLLLSRTSPDVPEEQQRDQACHAQDSKDDCEQDLPVNVVVLDAKCCDGEGEAENGVKERHEGDGEEARCDREVRVAAVG